MALFFPDLIVNNTSPSHFLPYRDPDEVEEKKKKLLKKKQREMKQEREMMLQRLGVKKSKKNESQGKGSVAKLNSPSKTPNSTKSKNILDSKGKKMKKKRSKMKTGGGFTVSDLE